jgi:hypothetical protein
MTPLPLRPAHPGRGAGGVHPITPCARASSPRWNASCSRGTGLHPKPRPAWPSSASSKAGTTRRAAIQRWATVHPWPTNRSRSKPPTCSHSQPSPATVHQGGAIPRRPRRVAGGGPPRACAPRPSASGPSLAAAPVARTTPPAWGRLGRAAPAPADHRPIRRIPAFDSDHAGLHHACLRSDKSLSKKTGSSSRACRSGSAPTSSTRNSATLLDSRSPAPDQ